VLRYIKDRYFKNSKNGKLKKGFVTVVMPAYNAEPYIAKSIDSVIGQSIPDWRLVILDDGSTDSTVGIAKSYAERHKKIELFQLGQQQGPAAQRNSGIRNTNTEFLAFLDSDDVMSPNSLEFRRDVLNEDEAACAAFSYVRLIDPNGSPMGLNGTKENIVNFTDLVENKFITSCIFARTDILKELGGFDHKFQFGEDWDLWLRMTRLGYYIKSAPESYIDYRQHADSFSHKNIYDDFCDRMRVSELAWQRDERVSNPLRPFENGLGPACQTMTRTKKAFLACISALFDSKIKDAENLLSLVSFELLRLTDPIQLAESTKWTVARNISIPLGKWDEIKSSKTQDLEKFFEKNSPEDSATYISKYIEHLTT
jgi:teichuronic acid biosynthesis glycosyltransferase TuaG